MFRTMLAVTAIAVGITAVAAQSDPIAARKQHMKDVGAQTKTGGGMAKGEVPYDQAKAQGIFAAYVTAGEKLPDLFPETSKTGGDTAACRRSGPAWLTSGPRPRSSSRTQRRR